MNYIEPEEFPLLVENEYSEELCDCGSGLKKSKNPRARNTAYVDPEMNWLSPCCDWCFLADWNYYKDAWDDYYSGLGV